MVTSILISRASLVTQTVKNLPAMQETWVWSLGWADPLEKGMATHSSSLAWRIPWTEEPGGLQSMGSQSIEYNRGTFTHILISSPWWNLLLSDVVLFIYVLMCSHPPPVLEWKLHRERLLLIPECLRASSTPNTLLMPDACLLHE